MDSSIIVSIISAAATLTGVVLSTKASNRDIQSKLETHQAVIDAKIDNLTQAVNKHNHFAERMPVIEEQIKVINHRLEDLERSSK
jgi:Tfp pilus assembly protein PilN